jgi:hypothetical protein
MAETPIGAAIPTAAINDLKKDLGVPAAAPPAAASNDWAEFMQAGWTLAMLPLTSWTAWMAASMKAWQPSQPR